MATSYKFSDKMVRLAFIRKVYLFLTLQLVLTFIICSYLMFNEGALKYFKTNVLLVAFTSIGTTIIPALIIICNEASRRTFPYNVVLFITFTLGIAFTLASVVAVGDQQQHVTLAVGFTSFVFIILTLFAFQTCIDFTGIGPYLIIGLAILIAMFFVTSLSSSVTGTIIYCSFDLILFYFYTIYDTQLMKDVDHKDFYSLNDCLYATFTIYVDIINPFFFIMHAFHTTSQSFAKLPVEED